MISNINFSQYFHSPEELAEQVLQAFCDGNDIIYPIDPFKLLSEFNIVYQFRDFDKLEGIYIVPEGEDDIPVVGINNNRPITRQRFTAAHELCHHIKDKTDVYCPIYGARNAVERYADNFAAALLMPIADLENISGQYLTNDFVEFDDVLLIADYFGVSFDSCVYRLAYKLCRISGDIDSNTLKKRIDDLNQKVREFPLG